MKKYRYILLDLDGTLTDSMEGITKSVQYALEYYGIRVDNLKDLCPFIGPPLIESFKGFYGFTQEQAVEASHKYHERFCKTGLYENRVYDGIPGLLHNLRSKGYTLMLATSKPEHLARQIVEHFGLADSLSFIGGSMMDGSRPTKSSVIRYVLAANGITDLQTVVMVGDRKHDILGAREVGIDSVGVLYGYGDYEELSAAGATYIVPDVSALNELFK